MRSSPVSSTSRPTPNVNRRAPTSSAALCAWASEMRSSSACVWPSVSMMMTLSPGGQSSPASPSADESSASSEVSVASSVVGASVASSAGVSIAGSALIHSNFK
eukprot:Plantae.Rhodophyta-Rhodochaete_pulchella.ctg1826.p2 GENE.Plantae.Rhodophyta-Rhodochaete_pulchella.ctg1826~~Plantae.Rhodophyta-Rhodochaete_pulchella.ctg1826.p2  ORF type:complete len:104 (-),score=0.98 Plantae.Rhodophyta-Rhodochaete_pulchella.ctg1826:408-719(-)